jgi:hypothetical protein
MSFPRTVQQYQAPAVEGDFASANPRFSVIAGEGALIAGVGGATVGRFGWADANGLVTNAGSGAPTGFLHRDNQALLAGYLDVNNMTIAAGLPVTMLRAADVWVKTATTATVGQKAFASNTDGSIKTGATGATIAGFTETSFVVDSAGAVGELIKISNGARP